MSLRTSALAAATTLLLALLAPGPASSTTTVADAAPSAGLTATGLAAQDWGEVRDRGRLCPANRWSFADFGDYLKVTDDVAPDRDNPSRVLYPEPPLYSSISMDAGAIFDNDHTKGTAFLERGPAHAASFSLSGNGAWSYKPEPGYWGGDSFVYFVRNSGGACTSGALVTIPAIREARNRDDRYWVRKDTGFETGREVCATTCGVLSNDLNAPARVGRVAAALAVGESLSIVDGSHTIATAQGGSVTIYANGSFSYTPAPGFVGTDQFYYQSTNTPSLYGWGTHERPGYLGRLAEVSLHVYDPSVHAADDDIGLTVDEDQYLVIPEATLLANDSATARELSDRSFPLGHSSTSGCLQMVGSGMPCDLGQYGTASHGIVDPRFENVATPPLQSWEITGLNYIPDPDFAGTDTFTYRATDRAAEYSNGALVGQPATVTVTVVPTPDPPRAVDDQARTGRGEQVTVPVLDNDTDPDGPLNRQQVPLICTGDLTCPDFNLGDWYPVEGGIRFTPAPGFVGTAEASYQITDPTGRTAVGQAVVEVVSTTAQPDQYSVAEDTDLEVPSDNGVLANDAPYGDASITAVVATEPENGEVLLDEDGSFRYTPEPDFAGTDTFEYTTDQSTAAVTIEVTPENDPPALHLNEACDEGADGCAGDRDPRTVDDGSPVRVRLAVTDPDYETGKLRIDWGDGTVEEEWYGLLLTGAPSWSPGCGSCVTPPIYADLTHTYESPGARTVRLTATDITGEESTTVEAPVLVRDVTAPVLTVPSEHPPTEATGPDGAVVDYPAPTAIDDVDSEVSVACVPAPGTVFPLGETSVVCTASDEAGNEADPAELVITVVDTTAPEIASLDDIEARLDGDSGAVVEYDAPGTSDAVDGDGTATCTPESGSHFPRGRTTVTCAAEDAAGNRSERSFDVVVRDSDRPSISLVTPAPRATYAVGQQVRVDYRCTDDNSVQECRGDLADGALLDTSAPTRGRFRVLATDGSGNVVTHSRRYDVAYQVGRVETRRAAARPGRPAKLVFRLRVVGEGAVPHRRARELVEDRRLITRIVLPDGSVVRRACSYQAKGRWFVCSISEGALAAAPPGRRLRVQLRQFVDRARYGATPPLAAGVRWPAVVRRR